MLFGLIRHRVVFYFKYYAPSKDIFISMDTFIFTLLVSFLSLYLVSKLTRVLSQVTQIFC